MKKVLTIIGLSAVASLGYSQGTVEVDSSSAAFAMYTNTAVSTFAGGNESGGTSGKTATTASGFDYILLDQVYSASASANPLDAGWVNSGVTAKNLPAVGGISGLGGTAGTTAANWGAPTANNYTDSTLDSYLLVGWSSNLGTTWATVSAELASNWSTINGAGYFFGESAIGSAYSGGGVSSPTLGQVNLLAGVSTPAPGGLTSGFTMYSVDAIPEPASMALIGLGSLGLLALRRKK